MRRLLVAGLLAATLASPLYADFQSKKVGEDIYYVLFKRSERMSGGFLDTDKKARKKLEGHVRKLCKKEGYAFVRFPTMTAVRNEWRLRDAWEEATGRQPSAATEVRRRGAYGEAVTHHHSHQRLVVFAHGKSKEFERCR